MCNKPVPSSYLELNHILENNLIHKGHWIYEIFRNNYGIKKGFIIH